MLVGHLLLALLVGTAAGTLEPRPGGDGESLNLSGCGSLLLVPFHKFL